MRAAPSMLHDSAPTGPGDVWSHWGLRASVALPLLLTAAAYGWGLHRLWRRGGSGRVVSRTRALLFAGGTAALAVALLSPLDPLGEVLFSAHMVQHLLLILVAAPLLVAGAPEVALLWALPAGARRWVGQAWRRVARTTGRGEALPVLSVLVATGTLWLWHVPALYDLAVANEAVHAAEHAAFLATAVLFWASVLRLRPADRTGNGLRILYVFGMAVQGSLLGALITLADRPLYGAHAALDAAWGTTPLVDQQLAGLIMWVPPALLYIGVAGYLFVGWLEGVGARARSHARACAMAE